MLALCLGTQREGTTVFALEECPVNILEVEQLKRTGQTVQRLAWTPVQALDSYRRSPLSTLYAALWLMFRE